jgi:hypothetical protein
VRFLLATLVVVLLSACDGPSTTDAGAQRDASLVPDACAPESDPELCDREGASCGALDVIDQCGEPRGVDCGACEGGQACIANRCECTGETDARLCAAAGYECGTFSLTDRCGRIRAVRCGSCAATESCGGGGAVGRCACLPETDAELCTSAAAACGAITVTDRCGTVRNVASCGACTGGETCGGALRANVCGAELCTGDGWCRPTAPIGGFDDHITAVWGYADAMWLSGARGTFRYWNGSVLREIGSVGGQHWGMWGAARDDAWTVGRDGAIYRFDGRTWTRAPGGALTTISSVWGVDANDIWAVGRDEGTSTARTLHWDGATWDLTSLATVPALYGVWAAAWNDVWAVGCNGTIRRYDGSSWTALTSGTTNNLYAVWGAAPNDVWVSGAGGTLLHWNGMTSEQRHDALPQPAVGRVTHRCLDRRRARHGAAPPLTYRTVLASTGFGGRMRWNAQLRCSDTALLRQPDECGFQLREFVRFLFERAVPIAAQVGLDMHHRGVPGPARDHTQHTDSRVLRCVLARREGSVRAGTQLDASLTPFLRHWTSRAAHPSPGVAFVEWRLNFNFLAPYGPVFIARDFAWSLALAMGTHWKRLRPCDVRDSRAIRARVARWDHAMFGAVSSSSR